MQGTYTDFSRFVFNKPTKNQQTDWSFHSSYLYMNMIKTEMCKSLCTSQNTFRTTYLKTYTDIITSCQIWLFFVAFFFKLNSPQQTLCLFCNCRTPAKSWVWNNQTLLHIAPMSSQPETPTAAATESLQMIVFSHQGGLQTHSTKYTGLPSGWSANTQHKIHWSPIRVVC